MQLVGADVVDRVSERRLDHDQRRHRYFHGLQDSRRRRLQLPVLHDEAAEKFAGVELARLHLGLTDVLVSWLVERCLHGDMFEPSADRQLYAQLRRVFAQWRQ